MTEALTTLFPVAVFLVVVAVVVLGVRLNLHLGQGSTSAGPLEIDRGEPPGQEATPWELNAIEHQLRTAVAPGTGSVRRYDLTATINRLSASAGLNRPEDQLPITADEDDLTAAVARLEQRLGLAPLGESTDR